MTTYPLKHKGIIGSNQIWWLLFKKPLIEKSGILVIKLSEWKSMGTHWITLRTLQKKNES